MVIATFAGIGFYFFTKEGKGRGRGGEGCSAYLSCNVYIEDELQEGR